MSRFLDRRYQKDGKQSLFWFPVPLIFYLSIHWTRDRPISSEREIIACKPIPCLLADGGETASMAEGAPSLILGGELAFVPRKRKLKFRDGALVPGRIFKEIPHNEGGQQRSEFFARRACALRRLTGGKSRNLQDVYGGKGTV